MSSPLLINEPPLQVLPSLAVAIGLNEALVLQQIHYWYSVGQGVEKYGHRWIYNTVEGWRKQFPFWSDDTITRTLKKLRERELVIADNLSSNRWDRTLYYRIDYRKMQELNTADCGNGISADCDNPPPQVATISITETTQRLHIHTNEAPAVDENLPRGGYASPAVASQESAEETLSPAPARLKGSAPRRKPSTAIPDGFKPRPEDVKAIREEFPRIDTAWLKSQTAAFCDHAAANDVRHVEWFSAWRNWIRNGYNRAPAYAKPVTTGATMTAGDTGLKAVDGTPITLAPPPTAEEDAFWADHAMRWARTVRQMILDGDKLPFDGKEVHRLDGLLCDAGEPGLLGEGMPLPVHDLADFVWSVEKSDFVAIPAAAPVSFPLNGFANV